MKTVEERIQEEQEVIFRLVENIEDLWILDQIQQCIINITKE